MAQYGFSLQAAAAEFLVIEAMAVGAVQLFPADTTDKGFPHVLLLLCKHVDGSADDSGQRGQCDADQVFSELALVILNGSVPLGFTGTLNLQDAVEELRCEAGYDGADGRQDRFEHVDDLLSDLDWARLFPGFPH
ncbi:hypothetical protein CE91St41_04550 [Oscillospiraceae bacterium]|nr:hypothetical protein CE91St40_04570 [Oscillospiraceae bacterium]BDF73566.1 hypothetical protein CE91St41_04550 [Oscillospiraceae bacterium]